MKIWVLTEEYNAYDQYGEYFSANFTEKPTAEQLADHLGIEHKNIEFSPIGHILNGGGRQGTEDQWYHLREVETLN